MTLRERIIDALARSRCALPIHEIARRVAHDPKPVADMLRSLAAKGLARLDTDGRYIATDATGANAHAERALEGGGHISVSAATQPEADRLLELILMSEAEFRELRKAATAATAAMRQKMTRAAEPQQRGVGPCQ